MTHSENAKAQYEDALFALLMEDVAAWQGEDALREKATLDDAAVPEEVRRRCRRIIERRYARGKARRTVLRLTHVMEKIALVALVAALTLTVAMAAFPVFRAAVLNLALEAFEDHETLRYDTAERGLSAGTPVPGWLPEGYTLAEGEVGRAQSFAMYTNAAGHRIQLLTQLPPQSINVDTENGTVISTGTVQGARARIYDHRDVDSITVIWVDEANGVIVNVCTEFLSMEDTLRFAENLAVICD